MWRDAMIAADENFVDRLAASLPGEVGDKRRPTAVEWDAGIDAALAASGGTNREPTSQRGPELLGSAPVLVTNDLSGGKEHG